MRKSTYTDTVYPGIKKRIKDGKYIVTLDWQYESIQMQSSQIQK